MADETEVLVVHVASGAPEEMRMVQDEFGQWVMAHWTKCGIALGSEALGVTDNAEDVTCAACA